jgi:hypothetical protein
MPTYSFKCAKCDRPLGEILWSDPVKRVLAFGDEVAIPNKKCKCGSTTFRKDVSGPAARMTVQWMP